jgi:CRP-like cAMP-binding protein
VSLLIENISKHIALNKEEEQLLLSKIEIKTVKAKTILLSSGQICKHSYFVNSGILRSFNINDNIVEHILSFACEGWWIGDMYSLLAQKPGNLFIEVLEDAEIAMLS